MVAKKAATSPGCCCCFLPLLGLWPMSGTSWRAEGRVGGPGPFGPGGWRWAKDGIVARKGVTSQGREDASMAAETAVV